MFDGIGKLASGNYEIRGGREGKIAVGFAIGAILLLIGVIGFAGYVTMQVQKELYPETSPLAHVEYWVAVETQRPLVTEFMICGNPISEMTDGIVRDTTLVQWSCTGWGGNYDHHYYEKLSNGVETAICSGDYVKHD